ncbi:MAG: hypothetical protein ACXVGR_16085, partial [Mycobacteriaceae bacterium]
TIASPNADSWWMGLIAAQSSIPRPLAVDTSICPVTAAVINACRRSGSLRSRSTGVLSWESAE